MNTNLGALVVLVAVGAETGEGAERVLTLGVAARIIGLPAADPAAGAPRDALVGVYALVVDQVEDESVRTATLEGALEVLTLGVGAALFGYLRIHALVLVDAKRSTLVQLVATRTDTPETAVGILASARGWAKSLEMKDAYKFDDLRSTTTYVHEKS